ncbi:hypothetical protein COLO4_14601 [Corchorus olitorius]|uniref:F-box domain-containing protein n=1 Tax=Corchorus olitorius TaxID=93759 RepID=A0A1R3JRJ3_9ROSI|nr:hypothetical protein COLO4_14601 [Corchorus olitorius]
MIPMELIFEIFLGLSVKDLLRFRCLSKEFCQEIDSAAFTTAQLNRSKKTRTHRKLVLYYCQIDGKKSALYVADFDDEISRGAKLAHQLNPDCCFINFTVYGSCNGLILLYNNNTRKDYGDEVYYRWLLVNPFTRKFKKVIPCPREESPYYGESVFGFGYDSIGNDYKLVQIIQPYKWEDHIEIWVFSFASNTWRKQKVPFCHNKTFPLREDKIGFFADGALHWLSERIDEDRIYYEIVTLDLSNEVFVNLVHSDSLKRLDPQTIWCTDQNHLLVLGGSLALLRELYSNDVELYLAVKCEEHYNWTKLYNICLDPPFPGCIRTALEVSKNGENLLLLMNDGKLYWYNLKKKKNNTIWVPIDRVAQHDDFTELFCCESAFCWESLVWPAIDDSSL